jgi:hypothetical protein
MRSFGRDLVPSIGQLSADWLIGPNEIVGVQRLREKCGVLVCPLARADPRPHGRVNPLYLFEN